MKKFISMAMALVMTLSLCTFVITPKADAGFDDTGDLAQYSKQAIDVIQTIQVMDGTAEGVFSPAAGLTRQAAAKIICNMILGPATAKALPTNDNPFPDVEAGTTFSGYISYCKQQGIISGYADGKFHGSDALSGYAYLKMLLGALGYASSEEGFTGSNWKVNVAKLALGINLNKGVPDNEEGEQLAGQITREAAAIYAFNTLQADMVEYEGKNTLEINGVKVTMGGANAVPQTWNTSSTSADNINNEKSDGNNRRPIVQFAERYFDKLERWPKQWDTYTQDDFGRPSIRWAWKGVDIGTYSRDPDAVFVGNVKVNAIYEALRENTGMSSGDDAACLYVNSNIPNNSALRVERSNDKDLDHANNLNKNAAGISTGPDGAHRVDRIGNGTIIEAYRNEANNHVDVCVISVYGGKVDSVKGATTKKDAYVVITVSGDPNKRPDSIMNTGNREFETEDFDEDDVVAYTYSDSAASIKSMYLMASESGSLQSKVSTKSLKLDGNTYYYGKEYTFNDLTEANLSNKSSYIVYLDENDYVLWVEEDEFSVDDYVLVERITIETTVNNVTTKTASVLGTAETTADTPSTLLQNSNDLQKAYNQSKDAVGNSSWDAQAQVRYSSGARRTITLDDSKNYRTSAASDGNIRVMSGNIESYEALPNTNPTAYGWVTKGAVGSVGIVSGFSGDDGNWIAEPFTAGHIVRVSSNANGYRLHSINNTRFYKAYNFSLRSNKMWENGAAINANGTTITADSETHFVIEDLVQGSYKSYYGVKNAPTVKTYTNTNGQVDNAVAYIYHTGGSAKLVFVTHAWDVSNSSNDIVFLAANSTSKLIESDDGEYYEVSAVEKNEVKTLMVKRANPLISFTANGVTFKPGDGDTEKEYCCVILNNVSYDSNDFVTKGEWSVGSDDTTGVYQGIRRVNDEEVRLNTAPGKNSTLKDIAENIRVYFVDGSNIEQIEYDEIINDTQDWVYYVEDDDGEVTYLFIVDYEDDGTPTTVAIAYNLNVTASVAAGYTVVSAPATVSAGKTLKYQVRDSGNNIATSATINSGLSYVGVDNFEHPVQATEEGGVWTVAIPTDIKDENTTVSVYVTAK